MLTIKTQKYENGTQNVIRIDVFCLYEEENQVRISHSSCSGEEDYFSLGNYDTPERCQEVIDEIFGYLFSGGEVFYVMPEE